MVLKRFPNVLSGLAALVLAGGVVGTAGAAPPEKTYLVVLEELNGSGVTGVGLFRLDGEDLTAHIFATGVEAGQVHPQHIHGHSGNKANATCPSPAADVDGDGLVSVGEGLPAYGPIRLGLAPFTSAPDGFIDFTEVYEVDIEALGPLQNRAVVLHGLTVDGEYIASLPIACGQIRVLSGG